MADDKANKGKPPPESPLDPSPRVIEAEELFHGTREVLIQHAGVRYRLHITRRNRLILQK